MATRPDRRLTYDDYVHFPEGQRWELIDGEAYVVPAPNTRHQDIVLRLAVAVELHLRAHGGGRVFVSPYDVVLAPVDVFQPDIVFVSDADADVITEANVWGTPSWAIEVLSPSTADRDRRLKLQRYERHRLTELWIVDPVEDVVDVYRLAGDAYEPPTRHTVREQISPVRPDGLMIDLGEILAR